LLLRSAAVLGDTTRPRGVPGDFRRPVTLPSCVGLCVCIWRSSRVMSPLRTDTIATCAGRCAGRGPSDVAISPPVSSRTRVTTNGSADLLRRSAAVPGDTLWPRGVPEDIRRPATLPGFVGPCAGKWRWSRVMRPLLTDTIAICAGRRARGPSDVAISPPFSSRTRVSTNGSADLLRQSAAVPGDTMWPRGVLRRPATLPGCVDLCVCM